VLPRSHAPHHCPHQLDEAREAAVLALRRLHPTWGPRKMKAWLDDNRPFQGPVIPGGGEGAQPGLLAGTWPAASTIGDLLDRHGLVAERRVRRRVTPTTAPFAGCAAANDLWAMDFKGWTRTGDGQRVDPLTVQDQASRYLLAVTAVAQTDTEHVQAVLATLFREYGRPKALRSDNGPPFGSTGLGRLSGLSVWLITCGVLPDHTDPASPQQNGRLERMHRDLKAETMAPAAASARQQSKRFKAFQQTYNHDRPHEGLGQKTPASQYVVAEPRAWNGRPMPPEYGDEVTVRKVRSNGEIKWRGGLVYLNSALAGQPVGLTEQDDGNWTIAFGPVPLGTLTRDGTVQRLSPPGGKRRRAGLPFGPCRDPLPHPTTPETVTHHAG
jgi:putative transposase